MTDRATVLGRRRPLLRRGFLALLAAGGVPFSSCRRPTDDVVVLHAGSLSPLIRELGRRFQSNHPHTRILSEPSGSLDAVRKVTDLGKSCDLLATSDHRLLSRFIVPRFCDRYYEFLSNEIVLATARTDLLTPFPQAWSQDWYTRMARHSFGISDPARDPAGYFAHLVWKLAEIHYNATGLYRRLVSLVDQKWVRPKSSELVALLQTKHLVLAFLYRSSAIQHNLNYVRLPPQISLGDPAYAAGYRRVFVRVGPGDDSLEIEGAPIRAGVALLTPDRTPARDFLNYLLSSESADLLSGMGYTRLPVREVLS